MRPLGTFLPKTVAIPYNRRVRKGRIGMAFGSVVLQMVAVSLPILLGWCLNKLDIMNDAFDAGISRLVLNVALPCSILASIDGAQDLPDAATLATLIFDTFALYAVSLVVAFVLTAAMRTPAAARGSFRFAIAFGNCGFIGLPIISAILGEDALLYAAIVLIPANIALYGVGPLLTMPADASAAERSKRPVAARLRSMLSSLKSPTLAASALVLVFALLGITDLGVAGDALSIVGQMATPLALLITGSSMAHYRVREMVGEPRAYGAAIGRLFIVPLACIATVQLMPLSTFARAVLVLDCSMPVATTGSLFCLKNGCDTRPMMQVTFLSVILSIASIPVVAMLCGA